MDEPLYCESRYGTARLPKVSNYVRQGDLCVERGMRTASALRHLFRQVWRNREIEGGLMYPLVIVPILG